MSDTPEHPMQAMATQARDAAEKGSQAAQEMGRKATEAGMKGMAEFTKMFSDMKLPNMPDMEGLLSAHRRNMEALSAANRVAMEGAQTVAKRHMEIMQQTMAGDDGVDAGAGEPGEPADPKAARQAEHAEGWRMRRRWRICKEIADLIQRSNSEAVDMLNKRFAEALGRGEEAWREGTPRHTADSLMGRGRRRRRRSAAG